MGIDLLSVSGHKIHAPKGTGFLYIRDKVKVKPIMYGGGQQKSMRSGTENVPGAAALGEASAEIYENLDQKIDHMYQIKQRFIDGVMQIPGVCVNGKMGRESAPQIVSISIEDVRSEVMLHSLEEYGIYVSAGSACSSNKPAPSRTLQAIGLPEKAAGIDHSHQLFREHDGGGSRLCGGEDAGNHTVPAKIYQTLNQSGPASEAL